MRNLGIDITGIWCCINNNFQSHLFSNGIFCFAKSLSDLFQKNFYGICSMQQNLGAKATLVPLSTEMLENISKSLIFWPLQSENLKE